MSAHSKCLNSEHATNSSSMPIIPTVSLPLAIAAVKQHTSDELLTLLNRTPLFMTELDETDGAGGENPELEALKALAYEGTRAEVADNFRVRGNEQARLKRWGDAKEFYGKALLALTVEEEERRRVRKGHLDDDDYEGESEFRLVEERKKVTVDEDEERRKEMLIEEACLINKALCNLELKNYGSCNRDCASTLRLNSRNIKAYYRSAIACLALDKIAAASDACTRALAYDPSNTAVQSLLLKINVRKALLEKQFHERVERQERKHAEAITLRRALTARSISSVISKMAPVDADDAKLQLENPLDPASVLIVPMLLLYPTHAQSDLIKTFRETESLAEHLKYIFPCPWDEKIEFTMNGVDCYMDTVAGGLVRVGKNVHLGEVLSGGKVELRDGLCKIFVVPKVKAEDWIAEVRRRKVV